MWLRWEQRSSAEPTDQNDPVLTAEVSYGAMTVPDRVVVQHNKQILTRAAFCGGHPSTEQFLTHNQKRLGARRQPSLVEFDPRLLAA